MRQLLTVPLALALAGCSVDWQGWAGMRDQPKALAFRESAFFADGRAMRSPPPGTVPRDWRGRSWRLRNGREAPDAGYVEAFPLELTRERVEDGQKSYDIYCATCHGVRGDGVSQVARNMGLRAPPSLLLLPPYANGYFFTVISEGFGLMGGYAEKLTPEQRWAVVAYVRALQATQRVRLEDVPPDVQARLRAEGAP